MKLVALFSGGKDSVFAILKAKEEGHSVEKLATAISENPDSYMFHTPNIGLTFMQSRCMGMQLVSKSSSGIKEKELEDLKVLLTGLGVEGVVCGAIASKYQKKRVEKICKELGLKLVAPLWGKEPEKLLREMIDTGFEIMITAVAADGFDESWLGRVIDERCFNDLIELNKKHKINVCGEGGEFETLVLDCPLFSRKLEITKAKKVWKENSGVYEIEDAKFVDKN
ncbi:MAG: diphthine--ammonia ligase [Candidatus Aenigmatarchaeota archaeon]